MKKFVCTTLSAVVIALVAPSAAYAAVIATWRMDEPTGASTMVDATSAGGANNGSIVSVQTGYAPLVSGKSYNFDGSSSYVSVPDNAALDPLTKPITVQATVQIADGVILDDSYDVIRKGYVTTAGGNWKMEIKRSGTDTSKGRLRCVFKGTTSSGAKVTVTRTADLDIVDGVKHTLKCVRTASQVQAVVDGRIFATSGATGSISNDQPVIIGAKDAGDDHFLGVIDQAIVSVG